MVFFPGSSLQPGEELFFSDEERLMRLEAVWREISSILAIDVAVRIKTAANRRWHCEGSLKVEFS
jgi:hypothetical protein